MKKVRAIIKASTMITIYEASATRYKVAVSGYKDGAWDNVLLITWINGPANVRTSVSVPHHEDKEYLKKKIAEAFLSGGLGEVDAHNVADAVIDGMERTARIIYEYQVSIEDSVWDEREIWIRPQDVEKQVELMAENPNIRVLDVEYFSFFK